MRNKTYCKKITLLFIIKGLLLQITLSVIPAVAATPLEIPSRYGVIKESYSAQSIDQDPEQTIICIQDAHCNYEAQKNIAGLLDYLVKEYNLRLVLVEGGSGNVNLTFLREYGNIKARQEIAEAYLKEGKISGEEYLDIVSDYDLELYGIEDEALYERHVSAFQNVDYFREDGLRNIEAFFHVVEALKPYLYNASLKQMDEKGKDYEDKRISLAEYCLFLDETAHMKGLDLKEYPNLVAFSETVHLEKNLDFPEVEAQRNGFIKDLAKLLDKDSLDDLIQKSQRFKSGQVNPQEFYSYLLDLSSQRIDLTKDYPQLNSYIRYVTISKGINTMDLLKEVNCIDEELKEASFTTNGERTLNEISKSVALLRRLLNLDLTPEDYAYFEANRPKFQTCSWQDFLRQNNLKHNLTAQPPASTIIDDNLDKLEEFYKLGIEREKAFIKNSMDKLNESGVEIAALISGGFHTPDITQMLKDKGYSYIVVAPVIAKKGDPSTYFSVLRNQESRSLE